MGSWKPHLVVADQVLELPSTISKHKRDMPILRDLLGHVTLGALVPKLQLSFLIVVATSLGIR